MDVEIPAVEKNRLLEVYLAWFVISAIAGGIAWRAAEGYNPEGTGLFNEAEATLWAVKWLQVIAALLAALFTSVAFGIGIISSRLRHLTEINRASSLAILGELRRTQARPQ